MLFFALETARKGTNRGILIEMIIFKLTYVIAG